LSVLVLLARIVTAAAIVVIASRATERAGPFIGAMIATLPLSTGPVYAFLAMDHDAQFISDAATASVASTAAIAAFVAAHALAAQRVGTAASLVLATLGWFAVAFVLQLREWSFLEACAIYGGTFALALYGLRRFAGVAQTRPVPRARFDIPLRAALVACVVVATSFAGNALGPTATGVLATYPVIFTCLVVILQPRCGGAFTASVLVNGLKGLLGFGIALAVLHLAAARMSSAPALLIALAVAVGWNYGLYLVRRRRAAARA